MLRIGPSRMETSGCLALPLVVGWTGSISRADGVDVKQTRWTLVDDIDGTPASATIRFGLDGRSYEIDLSDENAARLRQIFAEYVPIARRRSGESNGQVVPGPRSAMHRPGGRPVAMPPSRRPTAARVTDGSRATTAERTGAARRGGGRTRRAATPAAGPAGPRRSSQRAATPGRTAPRDPPRPAEPPSGPRPGQEPAAQGVSSVAGACVLLIANALDGLSSRIAGRKSHPTDT